MKFKYIAIEREYGSGATEIAHRLSQETGVPCYGREILEEVSRKYGLSIDEIEKYEESVQNSFIYSIYVMGKVQSGDGDYLARDGHIYVAEQAAIQEAAAHGLGIFVGHCAAEALKECRGVVKVFIRCSDEESKKQRIQEEYGVPTAQTDATRRRYDKKRANYYYANTHKKWDDMNNYDVVLDSAALGVEGCVDMLKGLLTE